MSNNASPLIGGKAIQDWDREWTKVPGGLTRRQKQLRPDVGLFRMLLGGQIVVVGSGTDKKHGIEKRLYDLGRPGKSSRDHHAGRFIYENRHRLDVEVLITGRDEPARKIARRLKAPMMQLHKPAQNVPNAPFMPKG